MTPEDDDDVDSGWDTPSIPPPTAPPPTSPPASVGAAAVAPKRVEDEPPSAIPTIRPGPDSSVPSSVSIPRPPPTRRVDVPLMRQSLSKALIFENDEELAAADDEEAPATRRAEDHELATAKARSAVHPTPTAPEPKPPPPRAPLEDALRPPKKPSRTITPVQGNAAQVARRLDAKVHSRPTPPARPPITPPPMAQNSALRFPADGLDRVRLRGRAATKVNFSVAELAKATLEEPRKGSMPALDLHLDGFDAPPDSLDIPVDEGVLDEETAPISELDDLPVAEMIESARPSAMPRRSAFPLSFAPTSSSAPPPQLEPPSDSFEEYAVSGLAMPVGIGQAEVSYGEELGLSEEEELALREELGEVSSREPLLGPIPEDPLAVTAEAPAGMALAAYLNVSASELENSAELAAQLDGLRTRFERGDFMGVLMRAEGLLESHPDCEPAKNLVARSEEGLRETYKARLGSGAEVLRVMMRPEEVQGLSLDHRAGFLMSLCDGVSTIDEVVDMSGMAELDVLRLLFEMREQGVVAVAGD